MRHYVGMSVNRRDVLAGMAAVGVSGIAKVASAQTKDSVAKKPGPAPKRKSNVKSVIDMHTPKLDKVRIAFIGVGARGSGHVAQMLMMDGVEIVAIADNYLPNAEASAKRCVDKGRAKPAIYANGDTDYKRMLDREDIDAVIISTPWEWHAPMALDAMRRGKHAFVEVPLAYRLDDLWELVETSEETRRHCMMMENVNYGREEMLVLNMAQSGVFGELLHGEAAYIHDLRGQMHEVERGTGSWRTPHYQKRNGNLYPTHGLGPVCHYMNINRGDRLDYMSSVSCNSRVRGIYAKENFPPDHKWNTKPFVCGDLSTSIIKTVNGKTIMVQWDEQLPRPYTRHNLLQGTKGIWAGFPDRCVIEGISKSTDSWDQGQDLQAFYKQWDHPLWKSIGEEAKRAGGHGGMDFVMLWRIAYCLRNGLPVDQDVYDGAVWSAIGPLSEYSVANRGASVDIPDFTRGEWKARDRVKLWEA